MLSEQEETLLYQYLESEEAQAIIENIRTSEPSRRVTGRAGNVCVRYASHKMRSTRQAESHRNELAAIYEMEHDENVLEYYDQPPPIKIEYFTKSGKKVAPFYTPDFFIIQKDPKAQDERKLSFGWDEWKMEEELIRLAEDNPNRYVKGEDGRWHCPPGEKYAAQFGCFFRLRSSAEIDWVFQRNMRFLEDYLLQENPIVSQEASEEILSIVSLEAGITLDKLLMNLKYANSDDIYTLIATEQIFVDVRIAPLAEPDRVHLFRDEITASAYVLLNSKPPPRGYSIVLPITIAIGTSVMWDDKVWVIVNDGNKNISLLATSGELIELPRDTFEGLIKVGKITGLDDPQPASASAEEVQKILTSDKEDLEKALERYYRIKPYLWGYSPENETTSDRTIRHWKAKYRKSEQFHGNGFIGLLSQHLSKGNRQQKLPPDVLKFVDDYISENYETLKQQPRIAVYRSLKKKCKKEGKLVPSYKTFTLKVKMRDSYQQKRKRKGDKAAYPEKPIYWELEVTTPRHGDRPFEIVHIDHTQLDIELIDSHTGQNLGRPWLTIMVDAFSRRILAVYLTFDPPSYRSCMMILRECVRRHGRLPQSIVADGGKEFNSVYFESFLALKGCSLYKRPWSEPHYGSVCERLFDTGNTTFVHNLIGNTQIMKNVRQVSKSVNPKELACWTLGSLYQALILWAYEVYDNSEHFTLGQTPKRAFNLGLIQGGIRPFKHIPYDRNFLRDTLPSTQKETAKVQDMGVKIKYIYYYCDAFRSPGVKGTEVPVRYDPFDMGQANAFVKGAWTPCISQYHAIFAGRSEREIELASKILRRRHQNSAKRYTITSSLIAGFLGSLEAEEALLLQRLHDMELKGILADINGQETNTSESLNTLKTDEPGEDTEDEEYEEEDSEGEEAPDSHAGKVVKENGRTYTIYEDF